VSNNKNHHVAIMVAATPAWLPPLRSLQQRFRLRYSKAPSNSEVARGGVWHNDVQLDNGQHILLGCYHHTLQLIEQVGGNIEHDFLRLPLQLTPAQSL